MGVFLEDVREQPMVLKKINDYYSGTEGQALLQEVVRLSRERKAPIILTGMGSSFFAARAAATYLWSLGHQAWFLETSELLHYGSEIITEDSLLILVSQSGESAEIKELISRLNGRITMVGVTNQLESTLGKNVSLSLPILAGAEGTTASKTYTATLAVLLMLSNSLGGGDFASAQRAVEQASKLLLSFNESVSIEIFAKIAADFSQKRTIALVGRGPGVSTALEGALTIKELAKVPAEGMEAAQFRHGPLEIAGPELAAIVVESPDRTQRLLLSLAEELTTYGALVVRVKMGEIFFSGEGKDSRIDINPYFAGLVDIYPIQLIADALAKKLGHDGTFKWISKVTSRE